MAWQTNGIIKESKSATSSVQMESIIEKIEADLYTEKIKKGRELKKSEAKAIIEEKFGTVEQKEDGKWYLTLNITEEDTESEEDIVTEEKIELDTIIGWKQATDD